MDILASPWFILLFVASIVIGNIAAVKYLSAKSFKQMKEKEKTQTLDRLIALDKKHHQRFHPAEENDHRQSTQSDYGDDAAPSTTDDPNTPHKKG